MAATTTKSKILFETPTARSKLIKVYGHFSDGAIPGTHPGKPRWAGRAMPLAHQKSYIEKPDVRSNQRARRPAELQIDSFRFAPAPVAPVGLFGRRRKELADFGSGAL
jgi:hypothetical protein